MKRIARRTRATRDERGVTLVETALILPLLLMVSVGVFDVALSVWQSNTLASAVREGTRYAIVRGSGSATPVGPGSGTYTAPDQDTAVTALVRANAIGLAGVTVRSTWPDGNNSRGSRVVVEATVPYTPALSQAFIGGALRVTLRSRSELVIHR